MDRKQGQLPGQRREGASDVLGPYVLRAEIARGELTTVHLAQKQGALGFQRLFAVKRLKPQYAHRGELAQLLIDEARLTAGLHHANVASVHDVGSEGEPYVVMDYVEGENLQILLSRASRDRHPRYIAPVVVDMLNGLHAVHSATGVLGEPLYIVHQAPTARHIIVGIDGLARLADFSQARSVIVESSRARHERLRVPCMAPEQALDPDGVDFRADLFIAGVVLWESLTGERLFAAESDAHTFQNVLHKRIPRPSEVGLRPPRCFDALVMRALERDPAMRHANALEMARELRDLALTQALYATAGEVGHWVKAMAGNELNERRQRVGAESVGVGEPSDERGSSGLFTSSRVSEDPYRAARLAGAYSHVPARDDLDRTPAMGTKTTVERPGRVKVTEVDGRSDRAPRAPEQPNFTPSGARVSKQPESVTPPVRGRHSTVPYEVPTASFQETDEESESTSPGGFVPARPGMRRDARVSSPGAYSEVKTRRGSDAPPVSRRSSDPDIFDEVHTSRLDLGNRRSASPVPSQMPRGPLGMEEARSQGQQRQRESSYNVREPAYNARDARDAREASYNELESRETLKRDSQHDAYMREPQYGRRSAEPPPIRRPVTEDMGAVGGRRDSLPARITLPEGPVGLPMGVPEPKPATPYEARPRTLEREALRQRAHNNAIALGNSLSPPTTAAHTAPPVESARQRRSRGVGFWISAGLLTGIIAVAGFVGVRNWADQQHAASGGVVAQPLPAQQVAPVQPAPVQPAPVQPAPVQPAPAPQPVVPVPAAAPVRAAATDAPGALTLPTITMDAAKPAAPVAAAKPVPAAKPLPVAKKKAWKPAPPKQSAGSLMPVFDEQPVSSEIKERKPRDRTLPDNPY